MGIRIVFVVLAMLATGAVFWANQHDRALRDGAAHVQIGDPNEVVRDLLGEPSSQGPCGTMTAIPKACTEEYVYRYAFSILRPEYEIVWFDGTGKVIGETRVVAP